jgi:hypothetical protein
MGAKDAMTNHQANPTLHVCVFLELIGKVIIQPPCTLYQLKVPPRVRLARWLTVAICRTSSHFRK